MLQSTLKVGVLYLGSLILVVLPVLAPAQDIQQLNHLVFEPSLIADTTSETSPPGINRFASLPLQLPDHEDVEKPTALEQFLEISGDEDEYLQAIKAIEAQDGAYSNALVEQLVSLGNLYQQDEDYDKAIEIYERAEYVSRINYGLFDATQFPIIEKSIDSFLATGNVGRAMQYQRYLIYLNEKYYGENDMSTVTSRVNLANQNMGFFSNVINRKTPVISFNVSMNQRGAGPSTSDDPRRQAFGNLFSAQNNYARAILALIKNKAFFRPEILELEYKYIETLFIQANRRAILDDPDYYLSGKSSSVTGSRLLSQHSRRNSYSYVEGKNAFERILVYLRNNPDSPPEAIAAAMMDYGDWHLLFNNNMSALRTYKDAYEYLRAKDVDPDMIADIASPAIPVHLPLITSKPNSREKFDIDESEILQPNGYIDISFTINRYGNARKLKILDSSENTTPAIENRLKRYLRNSPFRPRFSGNEPAKSDQVTLRYFYTFLPENA